MLRRPPLDSVRGATSNTKKYNSNSSSLKTIANFCYKLLSCFMSSSLFTSLLYILVISVMSLITDHLWKPPLTYFSNTKNIFNVYFVKLGWGWTLAVVGVFTASTSYIRSCGKVYYVLINAGRLIFGTFWWYICVSLIDHVYKNVGFCSGELSYDKLSCTKTKWSGLDISGHVFLLLFNILIILEEVQSFTNWDDIPDSCSSALRNKGSKIYDGSTPEKAKNNFNKFSWIVHILIVLITILFLLWNFMLFSTLLYFHNFLQKVLGGLLAILGWFILYKCLFKIKALHFRMPNNCGLF